MRPATVAFLATAATTAVAHADPNRCAQTSSALSYSTQDIPSLGADTGWFPSGSPVQLKIAGRIAGTTSVAMGLQPTACWDEGMAISTPGEAQTGMLDSEYGAELSVEGKIHAHVLLVNYDWQGNIPLPEWLPTNLLMAGTTTFDPTALPGSSQPTVSVTSNPTDQIRVLSANVLSQFISIPGIDGDLYIAVQGQVTTKYHTNSIAVGDGAITDAAGQASAARPEAGFAGSLSSPISAAGTVHYDPLLIFSAHANVKILGVQIVNWTIATVNLPLPGFDRQVTLTGDDLKFGLPYVKTPPTSLGFATGASQPLTLHNDGGAPLVVSMQSGPSGVTVGTATIPPGQDGAVQVTAADPEAVDGSSLVLATNDPDHPQLTIFLDAEQTGQGSGGDKGIGHAGGCAASRSGSFALVALVLGLVMVRRGRRSGSR